MRMLSLLTLILLSSLLFGCLQNDNLDEDFGPEIDPNLVFNKEAESLGDTTRIQTDDWVVYQESQQAFTGKPSVTGAFSKQVISRDETDGCISGDFIEITVRTDETGEEVRNEVKKQYSIEKVSGGCDSKSNYEYLADSVGRVLTPFAANVTTRQFMEALNYVRESFHNFSFSTFKQAPPPLVQDQTDPPCAGLPNCEIEVTKISYDYILWTDNGGYRRVHYDRKISKDVPLLGSVVSDCQKLLAAYEGRRIPVTFCSDLANFQFGEDVD
jgi:hypothetical protein